MDFYDVIKNRLSIRQYKSDAVEDEKLARVLQAARIAPSAKNLQPWHFIVIRDEEVKLRLKPAYDREWFYSAPIIICACSDIANGWVRKDGRAYRDVDLAITFDHLVLAATAEGLGTCWIGAFDADVVRDALGIPAEFEPLLMTPLGYPAAIPQPRDRKALADIVHWDGWED